MYGAAFTPFLLPYTSSGYIILYWNTRRLLHGDFISLQNKFYLLPVELLLLVTWFMKHLEKRNLHPSQEYSASNRRVHYHHACSLWGTGIIYIISDSKVSNNHDCIYVFLLFIVFICFILCRVFLVTELVVKQWKFQRRRLFILSCNFCLHHK